MRVFFRVLQESLNFALNALRANRLRTFLSLLGVTFGIFSIVAVLAAVDSMKHEIVSSFEEMDSRTIFLSRMSFGQTDVPVWKRQQFENISYDQYNALKHTADVEEILCYNMWLPSQNLRYKDNLIEMVQMQATTEEYPLVDPVKLAHGRYFNEYESHLGASVIVIGHDIAENLFGSASEAMDKQIRVMGKRVTVIGVIEKQGESAFSQSRDNLAFIPINLGRSVYGSSSRATTSAIIIKPDPSTNSEAYVASLESRMRSIRGLDIKSDNDFFINEIEGLSDFVDQITGTLNTIGFVISGFSLLVGGFGIANIMFVSVKERTNIIGIQKALGAKNRFILLQFLFEAVILSVLGGLIGIIIVFLGFMGLNAFIPSFTFILSPFNISIGLLIASTIGFISGILPALTASKLDPVDAIRTGM
ncbi:MAG TPA: ABC transporter permease [Flavobacteriaceae bacterium]|nr:ABC transporter permease [Flavobacteriaceae bacterium]